MELYYYKQTRGSSIFTTKQQIIILLLELYDEVFLETSCACIKQNFKNRL